MHAYSVCVCTHVQCTQVCVHACAYVYSFCMCVRVTSIRLVYRLDPERNHPQSYPRGSTDSVPATDPTGRDCSSCTAQGRASGAEPEGASAGSGVASSDPPSGPEEPRWWETRGACLACAGT